MYVTFNNIQQNTYWFTYVFLYDIDTGVNVRFTQDSFFGSETEGSMLLSLELVGGTVSIPFDVTITPSEQSPMSAEGNSVISLHVDYVVFD